MGKRQKRVVGDILSIPLHGNRYGFGQVLSEPLVAFFDYEATDPEPPEILDSLKNRPIAFAVWVMNNAIQKGRWKIIGHLAPVFDKPANFFRQDALTGALSITSGADYWTPATKAQCHLLERAAIWDPSHIEDRLIDHFDSKPNKWVESLRAE